MLPQTTTDYVYLTLTRPFANADLYSAEPQYPFDEIEPNTQKQLQTAFTQIYHDGNIQDFIKSHRSRDPRRYFGNGLNGSVFYSDPGINKLVTKVFFVDPSTIESRYASILILLQFHGNPCFIQLRGFYPPIKIKHPTCCQDMAEEGSITMDAAPKSLATVLEDHLKLGPDQQFIMMLGIAFGMKCVHNAGMVYAVLKPTNVLLTDDFEPMLGDFGYVAARDETPIPESQEYRYTEVVYDPCTKENDVFSYAMVSYAIATGHQPFFAERATHALSHHYHGERDQLDDQHWASSLIERCWSVDATKRPGFEEIFNTLVGISDSTAFRDSVVVHNYVNKLQQYMNEPK